MLWQDVKKYVMQNTMVKTGRGWNWLWAAESSYGGDENDQHLCDLCVCVFLKTKQQQPSRFFSQYKD